VCPQICSAQVWLPLVVTLVAGRAAAFASTDRNVYQTFAEEQASDIGGRVSTMGHAEDLTSGVSGAHSSLFHVVGPITSPSMGVLLHVPGMATGPGGPANVTQTQSGSLDMQAAHTKPGVLEIVEDDPLPLEDGTQLETLHQE
jgi:hypothetical protein